MRGCWIASTVNVEVGLQLGHWSGSFVERVCVSRRHRNAFACHDVTDKWTASVMTRAHGRVKALPSAGTLSTWNEVNSAEPDPKLVGTEIRYGT